MKRLLSSTILVAAAALAGCNQSDHNLSATEPFDPQANIANSTAPVALPPAITAQKVYRCKDNSVVYIDWLSDGSARAKKDRNDVGTSIPAGDASLTGDAAASSITYKGQSCKA
jgi:hypothetical protein